MTEQEFKALVDQLGPQVAAKVKAELDNYDAKVKQFAADAVKNGNLITKESFDEYKNAAETAIQAVKDAAVKQGTTLEEISMKLNGGDMGTKSIAEQLKADEEALREVYASRGTKSYLVNVNAKGEWKMKPIDTSKTAGPNASISGINGGTAASIAQALDAATLLRVGAGAMINSQ